MKVYLFPLKHHFLRFTLLALLFTFIGCSTIPNEVTNTINSAGKNKAELIKVIEHYKQKGENERLKAAYFLISNMNDKYGIYYNNNEPYYNVFDKIESFAKYNDCQKDLDIYIDSLSRSKGLSEVKMQVIYDKDIIPADYLIENIDYAFKVWKEKKWAKHLNFNEFCDWILPYRINNEPLQPWRKKIYTELDSIFQDHGNVSDPKVICESVNNFIAQRFYFSNKCSFIPHLGGIDAWKISTGLCSHRYQLIVMAMRSFGVPVSIDFTPQFPRKTGSHDWTVLLDSDKKTKAFNGGEKKIKIYYPNECPIGADERVTAIYRKTFRKNTIEELKTINKHNLPSLFQDNYLKNVTDEYENTKIGNIELTIPGDIAHVPVYLYSFNYGENFTAVDYTFPSENKLTFNNIGTEGIYFTGTMENNRVYIINKPFIFNDSFKIKPIQTELDKLESVKLTRKFSVKWTMLSFTKALVGARIEGSNNPNFSSSDILLEISSPVIDYKQFEIKGHEKYRYFRFLPANSMPIRISEIKFIFDEKSNQTEKVNNVISSIVNRNSCESSDVQLAFDNKIETSFNAEPGSWFGIDASKRRKLNSLKILPRNHLNIIEPQNIYELFYFNNGWISLGEKISNTYEIEFTNVPKGALLLLKNKTKGIEERIFIYENDKQIWW